MSLVERFGPSGPQFTVRPAFGIETPLVAEPIEAAEPDPLAVVESADVRLPYNAVTGVEYRGGNILRLATAEVIGEYGAGGWAGFKQWLSVGRVVRKGEHGTACITVTTTKGEDGKPGKRSARGFRMFHFDQTAELETT